MCLGIIGLCLGAAWPAWGEASAPAASVPQISTPGRQFLSRLVRRTLLDATEGRPVYEPSYVPAELESLKVEVVVRLRQKGFLAAEAYAGPSPVAHAARDAALAAIGQRAGEHAFRRDEIDELLIELEVVGEVEPISVEGDWTQPRVIDPLIEPGVHGMVIRGTRGQKRFCPTEVFTSDLVLSEALKTIAQNLHSDPSQVGSAKLFRFRTAHWIEPPGHGPIVSLHRGMTLVPPAAVTSEGLAQTIDQLAEYMIYRQQKNGLFAYQYETGADRYTADDNLVRQAGAAQSMALHAANSGRRASLTAADAALRHFFESLTPVPGESEAAFIATPDRRNKLGVTALVCLAAATHPQAEVYAEKRQRLIKGMLWLQRPSGMFITAFPPALEIDAQEYFPGEALLAMATEYDLKPDAKILEAFDRAIAFYQTFFREEPSPAFVPWQVQAFALMAKHTKRRDYVDFVFELSDWLAAKQLDQTNNEWPELWGGIASYQPGRAGVATAAYLEGFADALALARSVGDAKRAAHYERVVRGAARFILQLQVRPEEAYFIRSPQDAVWAIRTGPALNMLRIDHCQHALVALIKTRQVLFLNSD